MKLPETRTLVATLDDDDALGFLRDEFVLPDGLIYLDGNSLGPPCRSTFQSVNKVMRDEWGGELIASWNCHDWIGLAARVASEIASIIGAAHSISRLIMDRRC